MKALYKFFILLLVISFIAPYIATEKPWYVLYHHRHLFPAFSFKNQIKIYGEIISYDETDWKHLAADKIIFAPIPWSPGKSDFENAGYVNPFAKQFFRDDQNKIISMPLQFRHWLGTDKRGADVFSGVLNGARVSLFVGICSMVIASLIGIFLGALAGYAGNDLIKIKSAMILCFIPALILILFYAKFISSGNFSFQLMQFILIAIIILLIFYFIGKMLMQIKFLRKKVFLRLDAIISRLIEWIVSLPRLIIVLSIAAITQPSILSLTIIIGCTSWTEIARLIRAEFLKEKQLNYVMAAKALGYSHRRIIFRHLLPNAITPSLVVIFLGISSAILAEAGLSFLGIGVPQNIVTWGNMLASGKENFEAWWLVVFPGSALFGTILLFNSIAERLRE